MRRKREIVDLDFFGPLTETRRRDLKTSYPFTYYILHIWGGRPFVAGLKLEMDGFGIDFLKGGTSTDCGSGRVC